MLTDDQREITAVSEAQYTVIDQRKHSFSVPT